jgi:hypothetical protein
MELSLKTQIPLRSEIKMTVEEVKRRSEKKLNETASILDLLRMGFIDCGELYVSRTSIRPNEGQFRYLIYLPKSRAYLWKVLHDSRVKVRVLVQLPEGLLEKAS